MVGDAGHASSLPEIHRCIGGDMHVEARRYLPGLDYQGIESNDSSFANPKDIVGMLFHGKFPT